MIAMKHVSVLLVMIWCGVEGAPTALKSPGQVREYLLGGAVLRTMFHMNKCKTNFPHNLPKYSFAYDVPDAYLSVQESLGDVGMSFHRMVNGSRLGLKQMARQLVFGSMDGKGQTEMTMADTDPTSGKVLTAGNFSGTLDSGCVSYIALTDKGQQLDSYDLLKDSLVKGFDVSYAIHPDQCKASISPSDEPTIWTGQVSNFRISKAGDVEFIRERYGSQVNTVVDVNVPPTGNASVTTYAYDTQSRATQWQVTHSCSLGSGLLMFK